MSIKYDQYLEVHRTLVWKAFEWMRDNIPEVLILRDHDWEWQIWAIHDYSKVRPSEYTACDEWLFSENRTNATIDNFNKALLEHIHTSPHHWQYWVLNSDDPDVGEICLDMPVEYIIEMVCDWWSSSWSKGNLREIFHWYEKTKNYIKLSDTTRLVVEDILSRMKLKLDELEIV